MNKLLLIFTLCSLITVTTYSQVSIRNANGQNDPLVMLDSIRVDLNTLFVDQNNIESITVLKDAASTATFGEEGRNGVILIKTKENHKYLKLDQLLELNNIPSDKWNLPVCINQVMVKEPRKIIAELNMIASVELSAGCGRVQNGLPYDGEVISITTKEKVIISNSKMNEGISFEAKQKDKPTLQHVVLFKFKDDASAADVKKVEDAFVALQSKIKEIKSLEWGTNISPENLNQGFTHCFIVTFTSEKDRDAYLPHPDHAEFGKVLRPHLDKVLVVDFWVKLNK